MPDIDLRVAVAIEIWKHVEMATDDEATEDLFTPEHWQSLLVDSERDRYLRSADVLLAAADAVDDSWEQVGEQWRYVSVGTGDGSPWTFGMRPQEPDPRYYRVETRPVFVRRSRTATPPETADEPRTWYTRLGPMPR